MVVLVGIEGYWGKVGTAPLLPPAAAIACAEAEVGFTGPAALFTGYVIGAPGLVVREGTLTAPAPNMGPDTGGLITGRPFVFIPGAVRVELGLAIYPPLGPTVVEGPALGIIAPDIARKGLEAMLMAPAPENPPAAPGLGLLPTVGGPARVYPPI